MFFKRAQKPVLPHELLAVVIPVLWQPVKAAAIPVISKPKVT